MKIIYKEPAFRTPEIKFDPENNFFIIKGRSLPEDANNFYAPYKSWLKNYFRGSIDESEFILQIDYFNSSSSRMILEMMYIIRDSINEGNKINIIWRYQEDDDEMMTVGEEIQTIIEVPMKMECISDED
ncbi:MAG: hypothetical protein C0599_16230 [Salinivirgaceae bacterium]|nr:MAG: hypothetical protein C0599_16230 [Salinivirgaceae bacterium]